MISILFVFMEVNARTQETHKLLVCIVTDTTWCDSAIIQSMGENNSARRWDVEIQVKVQVVSQGIHEK